MSAPVSYFKPYRLVLGMLHGAQQDTTFDLEFGSSFPRLRRRVSVV